MSDYIIEKEIDEFWCDDDEEVRTELFYNVLAPIDSLMFFWLRSSFIMFFTMLFAFSFYLDEIKLFWWFVGAVFVSLMLLNVAYTWWKRGTLKVINSFRSRAAAKRWIAYMMKGDGK